ncbi:MAG: FecR domain-containing protein, partial [Verrucomicrobiales bacterium]|nr:FecR domain-containing protein [Verrucomicrobiales bacterium]
MKFWQVVSSAWLALSLHAADPTKATENKASTTLLAVEGTVEVLLPGTAAWKSAGPNQVLHQGERLRTGRNSRATLHLSDSSVLRVGELTTVVIEKPGTQNAKSLLDIKSGSVYFFSREKPEDIQFRTPVVAGAIRGTEFTVDADETGKTEIALLDGEIEVKNEFGQLTLRSGEQANAESGKAPAKTALISAANAIQWTLYYPAVLHLDELDLPASEQGLLAASLDAYRNGDLLQALKSVPENPGRLSDLSESANLFLAELHLSVGRVEEAEALLATLPLSPLGRALREMIAAVKFEKRDGPQAVSLASQMLARSYYEQSRSRLREALAAAASATRKAPAFGLAWVRMAELEFSFGRTAAALAALDRAQQLSPRNPQAFALRGFILLAENKHAEARSLFDQAISIDGALGNAWLGRGISRMRLGQRAEGRRDLQVASTLESQRSLFRSYLAKAWIEEANDELAVKELRLAKKLDPNDPTPWLYSALFNQQRNR